MHAKYAGQPIAALVAFKAKQPERVEQATAELVGLAEYIIVTGYGEENDVEPYGEDPKLITALCKTHGIWEVEAVADPHHAWRQLLARPEPILLVTGSFYLFNEIRPFLKKI
jgi:folylpolyglutamate synthase/dihydropteroate synthase